METVDSFAPIPRSDPRSSTELAEDNVTRTVAMIYGRRKKAKKVSYRRLATRQQYSMFLLGWEHSESSLMRCCNSRAHIYFIKDLVASRRSDATITTESSGIESDSK